MIGGSIPPMLQSQARRKRRKCPWFRYLIIESLATRMGVTGHWGSIACWVKSIHSYVHWPLDWLITQCIDWEINAVIDTLNWPEDKLQAEKLFSGHLCVVVSIATVWYWPAHLGADQAGHVRAPYHVHIISLLNMIEVWVNASAAVYVLTNSHMLND